MPPLFRHCVTLTWVDRIDGRLHANADTDLGRIRQGAQCELVQSRETA